jgi:hypothetical protein
MGTEGALQESRPYFEQFVNPPNRHLNPLTGQMEPWPRCVYCNTHALHRPPESTYPQDACDCGRTTTTGHEP